MQGDPQAGYPRGLTYRNLPSHDVVRPFKASSVPGSCHDSGIQDAIVHLSPPSHTQTAAEALETYLQEVEVSLGLLHPQSRWAACCERVKKKSVSSLDPSLAVVTRAQRTRLTCTCMLSFPRALQAAGQAFTPLGDDELFRVVQVALERGNFTLVVSLFDAACSRCITDFPSLPRRTRLSLSRIEFTR